MFEGVPQDSIRELRNHTTSKILIKNILRAAEEHLKVLKAKNVSNIKDISLFEAKRAAFFEAAFIVEEACWDSADFTTSYRGIILSLDSKKSLEDSILRLESWIKKAKDYGF